MEIDLKAPIINKESFKLLAGYKYTGEFFDISNLGADFSETFQRLDNVTLKSSNFSALATKSINEDKYLAFRLRYTANGNYDGLVSFDDRFAIYKALAVFGVKKHDDLEWGLSLIHI